MSSSHNNPTNTLSGPNFIYHDLVMEGLGQIFNGKTKQSVVIPDPKIKKMICLIPLTANGISLFDGIMGIGKGVSTRAIHKVFYSDQKIGIIRCDPNKRPEETLFETDVKSNTDYTYDGDKIHSTTQVYDINPDAKEFIYCAIKFINEISRGSKAFQDRLLGLFEEGELEEKGQIFKSLKPDITILDQNPAHMQNNGHELEPALKDRADIKIPMPAPSISTIIATQTIKTSKTLPETLPAILTYSKMKEIYEDIAKVEINYDELSLFSVISQLFFTCKHRRDIANEYFLENINCNQCSFDNGICKYVKYPIGQRFMESTISFAKSKAWLEKRTTISMDDLMFILPFTLNHRITLQPDTLSSYPDAYTWITEYAIPELEKKKPMCAEMINSHQNIFINPTQKDYETIFERAKNNLLYTKNLIDTLRIHAIQSNATINKFIDLLNMNPDVDQIQQLKEEIGYRTLISVPLNQNHIINILNDITLNKDPQQNYTTLLKARENIEAMLKTYEEQNNKVIKYEIDIFASKVYPELASMCPASKIKTIQESLTKNTEITINSVVIKITRELRHVKVQLTCKNRDKLAMLVNALDTIPTYTGR